MSTNQQGTSVEELARELEGIGATPDTEVEEESSVTGSEAIVAEATADLAMGDTFQFEGELVKQSLDELLVVLIALSDGSVHGKGLMGDLADVFGVHLSPGTVYPKLHDLEEAGVLEMHELVRTKEYRIADADAARDIVERGFRQHFAIGGIFNSALEEL